MLNIIAPILFSMQKKVICIASSWHNAAIVINDRLLPNWFRFKVLSPTSGNYRKLLHILTKMGDHKNLNNITVANQELGQEVGRKGGLKI